MTCWLVKLFALVIAPCWACCTWPTLAASVSAAPARTLLMVEPAPPLAFSCRLVPPALYCAELFATPRAVFAVV
ncbi:MAG: hypothetical protein CMO32_28615 [Variovorax sp.]|nr:hypothetical protein [Variovorax sp.]